MTLNITSGWNLGGPTVTPEEASKVLTWTRTQVKGGAAAVITLPKPEIKNGFYRQIAVLSYPLAHGTALAPQPGSRAVKGAASGPAATEKRSMTILKERSAGAEAGFSMTD